MSNVLVRDLPEDVHRRLAELAKASGSSLQQYLTVELTRLARTASLDEIVARIEQRSGGSVGLDQAAEDLDQVRSGG